MASTSSTSLLASLTPEQQQALYDQAGFLLVKDLPQGSLAGIDGSCHQTLAFSGYKLLPPSLHLAVFAPPLGRSESPVPAPRTGTLFFSTPRQVIARTWSRAVDSLAAAAEEPVVSREVLQTLDKELAPYPYDLWPAWKPLLDGLTKEAIERVLGSGGDGPGCWDLDGFEIGEEEELAGGGSGDGSHASLAAERVLRHRAEREGKPFDGLAGRPPAASTAADDQRRHRWAQFDIRRSWRAGALGEEVSLFARDKSWLFADVVERQCGGDPHRLLDQLALLLPLGIELQAPALILNTYRRLLALVTQARLQLDPLAGGQYLPPASPERTLALARFYLALIKLVHAQAAWLPPDFFATELPEAEGWWRTALVDDLLDGIVGPSETLADHLDEPTNAVWTEARTRGDALRQLLADRFGWIRQVRRGSSSRGGAAAGSEDDDESEEEDEEDRPVLVDNPDHYTLEP